MQSTVGLAASKQKLASAIDLMRKGATLVKEPCPRCGGIQVKYKERMYCVTEDDLSGIGRVETVTAGEAVANLRDLVLTKIQEATETLHGEKDVQRQAALASLLLKYLDIVEKTTPPAERKKETKPQ